MESQVKSLTKAASEHKEIILRYKNEFPYLSNTKLAKLIVDKEKLDVGFDYMRKVITFVKDEIPIDVALEPAQFDIEIPDTLYNERERFKIPTAIDRLLFISDLHIPFHSIDGIRMAIKYGHDNGMRGIYLGGDIVDFYAVSRYDRLPHLRNIKNEIEGVRQFLYNLRDKFPDIEIYFKIGNHEHRYTKFLMERAPELFEVDSIQLDELLHLNRLRIKLVGFNTITEYGRLNILHGHEILGGGIHTAHNFRIKAGDHVLFGHFHRTQESLSRNIKDNVIGAWSVGCLCGLSPDYMPINNWNHGFAFITRQDDGNFVVKNKTIINGFIY